MKVFTYQRATTPAQAAQTVARTPGSRFIAGGTNLLDLMKLEIETPGALVDVNKLGFDKIEPTANGGLRIGAFVRNTDLASDPRVRKDYAVLSRALLSGASTQLRSHGSVARAIETRRGVSTAVGDVIGAMPRPSRLLASIQ